MSDRLVHYNGLPYTSYGDDPSAAMPEVLRLSEHQKSSNRERAQSHAQISKNNLGSWQPSVHFPDDGRSRISYPPHESAGPSSTLGNNAQHLPVEPSTPEHATHQWYILENPPNGLYSQDSSNQPIQALNSGRQYECGRSLEVPSPSWHSHAGHIRHSPSDYCSSRSSGDRTEGVRLQSNNLSSNHVDGVVDQSSPVVPEDSFQHSFSNDAMYAGSQYDELWEQNLDGANVSGFSVSLSMMTSQGSAFAGMESEQLLDEPTSAREMINISGHDVPAMQRYPETVRGTPSLISSDSPGPSGYAHQPQHGYINDHAGSPLSARSQCPTKQNWSKVPSADSLGPGVLQPPQQTQAFQDMTLPGTIADAGAGDLSRPFAAGLPQEWSLSRPLNSIQSELLGGPEIMDTYFTEVLVSGADPHTYTKRQNCNKCGRTLADRKGAVRHYRTKHMRHKPFGCNICGRRWTRQDHQVRHMRTCKWRSSGAQLHSHTLHQGH